MLFATALTTTVSCSATRFLEDDERLLYRGPKFMGANALEIEDLAAAVRVKPNRKVLGNRLFLHLYNVGRSIELDSSFFKEKIYRRIDRQRFYERSAVRWLKEVAGEAPALVDEYALVEDCKNLENLYFSRGYLNARVWYELKPSPFNPQKITVRFRIREGPPFLVAALNYESADSLLLRAVYENVEKSILKPGQTYNENLLAAEREHIGETLRNRGYYAVGPKDVSYRVDSAYRPVHALEPTTGLPAPTISPPRRIVSTPPPSPPPPSAPPDSVSVEWGDEDFFSLFFDEVPIADPVAEKSADDQHSSSSLQSRPHFGFSRLFVPDSVYVERTVRWWSLRGENARKKNKFKAPEDARWVSIDVVLPDSARVYRVHRVEVEILSSVPTQPPLRLYPPELERQERRNLRLSERMLRPDVPFWFIVEPRLVHEINLNAVASRISVFPDSVFRLRHSSDTRRRLLEMGAFQNVRLTYLPDSTDGLNAKISLSPLKRYSFKVGMEAFQNSDRVNTN
ncbi:MAG: hypothetical protein RMM53_11320, partial [Bacteroidia bacterium]|nr:hypothetical protein [Bacteroidia bacterium]MDW8334796.1 hypothetical protein [Bacteroidia bacterium]